MTVGDGDGLVGDSDGGDDGCLDGTIVGDGDGA